MRNNQVLRDYFFIPLLLKTLIMKLLLLLLALPIIGFGQKCISGNCVNGQGTYTYANGDKYVGEYKDDKIYGQGTFTRANGNKYVGELMDNKMHGQGTFTFTDGTIGRGLWENGNIVGDLY